MDSYELVDISGKTFDLISNNSCEDAPWAILEGSPMLFLKKGVDAGLNWKIHNDVLTAYTKPRSKAGKERQERARKDMEWSANLGLYPSGIVLFEENRSGTWEEDGSLLANQDLAGKDHLTARLMRVFWQDIPPLAWNQLTEVLVKREFENQSQFYGNKIQVAQDYLDFGKAFRALSHVGKLEPEATVDWESISNPAIETKQQAKRGARP